MGLYFFISGYFIPGSYDRQGFGTFVRKKILRLGVPLLLMGGLLTSATGKVEIAHMWFVESLLIFSFFYAVVRKRRPAISKDCNSRPTIIGLFVAALVMGIGSHYIRQVSPQDNWISLGVWKFEPSHYLQYVMMFVAGILAYRFCWLDKMTNKTGVVALLIGGALAIGNYVRRDGAWNDFVWQWFGIYESLMCVFISFGLLWLFRDKVNMSSELWSLHCPFAVDDWCSECVRRRVDGCFWQVRVRRRCHNRSVIRPDMAVAPVAGSEEGFMNIFVAESTAMNEI